MRKRYILLMVALAAMVTALGCRGSRQAQPREFTNSVGMKFVRIGQGSFKMGGEGEGPIHDVTLSKGFYLQTTEVTQAQWEAVMGDNPSYFKGSDRPVEKVSWNDIQEFLRKLNAKEKATRYRLPTEAEWEYACRVGGREPDEALDLGAVAWWSGNSRRETHPVGRKKPNAWGLYDMRGNVSEWVQDRHGEYSAGGQIDPLGPESGDYRVIRGGSWLILQDFATCSNRSGIYPHPDLSGNLVGFRCARTL